MKDKATEFMYMVLKFLGIPILSKEQLKQAKMDGRKWQYNPNDKDDQCLHAHDYDNGHKINITNGYITDTRIKKYIGKYSQKQLTELRNKLKIE